MSSISFTYGADYDAQNLVNLGDETLAQFPDRTIGYEVGPILHGDFGISETATPSFGHGQLFFLFSDHDRAVSDQNSRGRGGLHAYEYIDSSHYSVSVDLSDNTGELILTGGKFGDVLRGGAAADILTGGGGNDILEGGAGRDTLDGGTGENTASYAHAASGVTVDLGLGDAAQTGTGDARGDHLANISDLRGSAFADRLTGDDQANVLDGVSGRDSLHGHGGNDRLEIGQTPQIVDGGLGTDTLVVHAGSAVVLTDTNFIGIERVEVGDDAHLSMASIDAGSGPDAILSLSTQGHAATITGTAGNDRILSGDGADVLKGGSGDDRISIHAMPGSVAGGGGTDTLVVEGGGTIALTKATVSGIEHVLVADDTTLDLSALTAGARVTSLSDAGHGATIIGTAGDDRLVAGAGGDSLAGGTGLNKLFAGSGSDTFHFAADLGRDEIYGFSTANDHLDLSAVAANSGDLLIRAVHDGADTQISLAGAADPAHTIILHDVSAASLHDGSLLFQV